MAQVAAPPRPYWPQVPPPPPRDRPPHRLAAGWVGHVRTSPPRGLTPDCAGARPRRPRPLPASRAAEVLRSWRGPYLSDPATRAPFRVPPPAPPGAWPLGAPRHGPSALGAALTAAGGARHAQQDWPQDGRELRPRPPEGALQRVSADARRRPCGAGSGSSPHRARRSSGPVSPRLRGAESRRPPVAAREGRDSEAPPGPGASWEVLTRQRQEAARTTFSWARTCGGDSAARAREAGAARRRALHSPGHGVDIFPGKLARILRPQTCKN